MPTEVGNLIRKKILRQEDGMKRLFELFAMLSILLVTMLFASCGGASHGGGENIPPVDDDQTAAVDEEIFIPYSDDFGRGTVRLESIEYARPDASALIARCGEAVELIGRESDRDILLSEIRSLLLQYESFVSMSALSRLLHFGNSGNVSLAVEYKQNEAQRDGVNAAINEVYAALADSEHRDAAERELLGVGFLGAFTKNDAALDSLLAEEKELSAAYVSASEVEKKRIFVELVKTRRLIADECGYASYTDYLYEMSGFGYSPEDADRLIKNVSNYIMPVYVSLANSVFYSYFNNKAPSSVNAATVVNDIYEMLSENDSDLANVFGYMLAYGLYSIDEGREGRIDASFVEYLPSNNSPVLYMTAVGDITDYTSLSVLFGQFFDKYSNYGGAGDRSLYVAEDLLPLLSLAGLNGRIDDGDYRYLYYSRMYDMLSDLVMQAYRARFEMSVYRLAYDKILPETIDELAIEAADALYLTDGVTEPQIAITDELVTSPYSTVTDCVAKLISLEIYFMELDDGGAGFEALKDVTSRSIPRGFDEQLENAGVESPFGAGVMKRLADKVHYYIMGYHYFEDLISE